MTNFQPQDPPPLGLTPKRLFLLAPVLLGLVVSGLLAAFWLLPMLQEVLSFGQRQQELQGQVDALPMAQRLRLRSQLDLERSQQQQAQLLQLVAGTTQLDTLLSQLAVEAAAAGVTLDSVEPLGAAGTSAETPNKPPPVKVAPAGRESAKSDVGSADPLQVEGLSKRSVLVSASGGFPQLLIFLRRLELLAPLVVVSDLNLSSSEKAPPLLKFNLSAYSRATKP
jgi:type IV pilus assembly protein PilO